MSKKIPIGISNFKEIIEENYYYIDKTKLIDNVINDGAKVKLFTRPRRFGKTLNMSMLRYFFDVVNAEENKKLFKDLYIEKTESFKYQGQYPVIYLSLKDLKLNSYEDSIEELKNLIAELYEEHIYILKNLSIFNQDIFNNILTRKSNMVELRNSLKFLSKILKDYYRMNVVLIIDEYDTPIVSAYEKGYYDEAIDFFRPFLSSVLKDNEYLQMGLMTGILRVAKEEIFSGLNNLSVYTILDNNYSEFFGLKEKEVEEALVYYKMEYNISEVKEWYNGYKFGNLEIYNPWSIINYISKKNIEPYWISTSSNSLINKMLDRAKVSGSDIFEKLEDLFNGKEIFQYIQKGSDFHDLINLEEIWQLFLYSGYLTVKEEGNNDKYYLKIPNKEVYSFFRKSFIERFITTYTKFSELIDSLENKNIEQFEKYLQEIMLSSLSYLDIDKEDEKLYHIFMIGLLSILQENYFIYSNRESGLGRYDISLEPKDKMKTGFILEFKVAKSVEDLERKSIEAFEQIEDRKYDVEMKKRGISDILKLGISFSGKLVKIIQKSNQNR